MNVHERTLAAFQSVPQPATAPMIHEQMTGQVSYAMVLSVLNDLVRSGKILESRNAVDKRVFSLR
jgi:hypothetical protein